jgi:hypothetical protein
MICDARVNTLAIVALFGAVLAAGCGSALERREGDSPALKAAKAKDEGRLAAALQPAALERYEHGRKTIDTRAPFAVPVSMIRSSNMLKVYGVVHSGGCPQFNPQS